jgi:hypothetical protein
MNTISDPEKDKLQAKLNGLKKKKELLETIDQIRQSAPSNQKQFVTDCYTITNSTSIHSFDRMMDLVKSVEKPGVLKIDVDDYMSGSPWGENQVTISIGEKFDEFIDQTRQDFHNVNKLLNKVVPKQSGESNNWVKYTNPFWLIIYGLHWALKHKAWSVILVLLTLAAIDYGLAWKNIGWLVGHAQRLFH